MFQLKVGKKHDFTQQTVAGSWSNGREKKAGNKEMNSMFTVKDNSVRELLFCFQMFVCLIGETTANSCLVVSNVTIVV